MLKREDSNKVLKGVKAVVFAASLSLLNPVDVEAAEVTIQTTEDNLETKKIIVETTLCGTVIISLTGIAIYSHKLRKNSGEYTSLGLKDDNEFNEKEDTKHIKIICK